MDTEYKITRRRMLGYADQARRIGKVDQDLSPADIENILLNVYTDSSLPEAEHGKFGTLEVDEEDLETGIYSVDGMMFHSQPGNGGYKFTVNEACSVVGLRCYGGSQNNTTVSLWTGSGELLGRVVVDGTGQDWKGAYLDTPVNLAVGEVYVVSRYAQGIHYSASPNQIEFNPKLRNIVPVYGTASGPIFPESEYSSLPRIAGVPDVVLAPVSDFRPVEYRVQRETLDAIADEMKDATGIVGRLSLEQMKALVSSETTGGFVIVDDGAGNVSISATSADTVIDDGAGNAGINQEGTT